MPERVAGVGRGEEEVGEEGQEGGPQRAERGVGPHGAPEPPPQREAERLGAELALFVLFFVMFLVRFSYDNFGSYSVRRYSLDETHQSAHPGYTQVVIKPIISSEISNCLPYDFYRDWYDN